MKKLFIALIVLVLGFGVWYYFHTNKKVAVDFGTYAYECDEHVTFTLTPSADLKTIEIKTTSTGGWPPSGTLTKLGTMVTGPASVNYEGNGVVLAAKGEAVSLWEGDSNRVGETALNCSPVPDQNNAPFNWGN
ncbi:MAG: hypothetical protein V4474_04595 [Patescibacteria group bacterium]